MAYLLDADTLIRAKNDYYGFDICPGFWEWLKLANGQGKVFMPAAVRTELVKGNDNLAAWVKALPGSFFISPSAATTQHFETVSAWVQAQSFTPAAISDFFSKADYFLVAQARELGYTVVTNETPDANSKKRVKIPTACIGVSASWTNAFGMLRAEKASFVLP